MRTPSQSPSNPGRNYDDDDIDMNFDVPQSLFHYDADDAGLGHNGSATPELSQGQNSVRPPVLTRTYHPDINGKLFIVNFCRI
jgi:hypothetical protein